MWLRRFRAACSLPAVLVGAGCHADHHQSMLHPASAAAGQIAWLWWFLLVVCALVFAAVLLLTALALVPRRGQVSEGAAPREAALGDRFILVSGVFLPAVVLVAILLASLRTQVALRMPETSLTIEVVGHQWWWEVRYPDQRIVTANEIHIPAGEPVRLQLTSGDVVHSFWAPNLQGKTDMIPGVINEMWIEAARPGVYRGQCAEYCGMQHALMALEVVALPRAEFDEWVAARQAPRPPPATAEQRRGEEVFFQASCHNCHAIAGTPAVGARGPDLTHLGSRRTIGAAILPNNRGNLAGWISNPQALKPGNLMPRTHLEADDLQALIAYLENLP
jgi:cytochrome c oxidase subunit II